MRALLLVAAVLTVVAVWAPWSRSAAGFSSSDEAAAYARGWVDGAAPPGWFAVSARCVASSAGWRCSLEARYGARRQCLTGVIPGFAWPGPFRRVHCGGPSS